MTKTSRVRVGVKKPIAQPASPAALEPAPGKSNRVREGAKAAKDEFSNSGSSAASRPAPPVARNERLSPLLARLSRTMRTPEQELTHGANVILGKAPGRRAPPPTDAEKMTAFRDLLANATAAGPLSAAAVRAASNALVELFQPTGRSLQVDQPSWAAWLEALPPMVESLLKQPQADRRVLYNATILWDYMPQEEMRRMQEFTRPMMETKFKPPQ